MGTPLCTRGRSCRRRAVAAVDWGPAAAWERARSNRASASTGVSTKPAFSVLLNSLRRARSHRSHRSVRSASSAAHTGENCRNREV